MVPLHAAGFDRRAGGREYNADTASQNGNPG
jgi:hypothetical protein